MAKTPQQMTDDGLWRTHVNFQNQIRQGGDSGILFEASHQTAQEIKRRGLTGIRAKPPRRAGVIVLDRETCDWVIDHERDTAICRTHGEVADGRDSPHFPGARL